jgi:hypothetical protein
MKALRQLGFLKLSLRQDGDPEDHRVLALFKNRAELKKAYGDLQEEIYRLKDLVKQQEGATQRVQEMLCTLETRLGTNETAYSALVFYQLRHLWQSGRQLVTQFVADLVRQQEERERRAHLAQHNRQLFAQRREAEAQLRSAQALHADTSEHLAGLAGQRAALRRLWHYFRRRALERRIGATQAALAAAAAALAEAQANMEAIARQPLPEFPGLSLPARRAINLAAIAYGEVLAARLAELKAPLVQLARQATAQREAGDDYGSPKDCVLLMGQIARAHRLIGVREGLAQQIRAHGERLKGIARYRSPADSAPMADSVAFSEGDVLQQQPLGSAARVPNVLAEDIWDLFRVLIR